MAIASKGLARILVVYDCCRSKNAKGISRTRAAQLETSKEVSYIAIAGTITGKTVPETSNLSKLIIERMNKKAINGRVRMPEDFASFTGDTGKVEKTL